MLRSALPDLRQTSDAELARQLRAGAPLAIAELERRTLSAAHSVARRLLGNPRDVEAVLADAYVELVADPPADDLAQAVRTRVSALAVAELRERGSAPVAPSVAALLDDLPAHDGGSRDPVEAQLAELDDAARRALVAAHDLAIPTGTAAEDAARALLALAGAEDADAAHAAPAVDAVLDLADPGDITALEAQPGGRALVAAMRRGRRRFEGLPPTADLGQRLVATLVAARAATGPAPDEPVAAPDGPGPSQHGAAGVGTADLGAPRGPATEVEGAPQEVDAAGEDAVDVVDVDAAPPPAGHPAGPDAEPDVGGDDVEILTDADADADAHADADAAPSHAAEQQDPDDTGPLSALDLIDWDDDPPGPIDRSGDGATDAPRRSARRIFDADRLEELEVDEPPRLPPEPPELADPSAPAAAPDQPTTPRPEPSTDHARAAPPTPVPAAGDDDLPVDLGLDDPPPHHPIDDEPLVTDRSWIDGGDQEAASLTRVHASRSPGRKALVGALVIIGGIGVGVGIAFILEALGIIEALGEVLNLGGG